MRRRPAILAHFGDRPEATPLKHEALRKEDIRAWIESRLDDTPVQMPPFRHLIVRDVFPPSFFEGLRRAWPPTSAFAADKKGRKFDLVPLAPEHTADPRAGGYATVPPGEELRPHVDSMPYS